MRTQLPYHPQQGWTANFTPEQNADNRAFSDLIAADNERREQLIANPTFLNAVRTELLRYPYITFDNIMQLAGSQHGQPPGPFVICDTVEKLLFYWHEAAGTDEQVARYQSLLAKDSMNRERQQDRTLFATEYDNYVVACQERKARHAQARVDHDMRVRESHAQLVRETSDPPPIAPRKRQ